VIRTRDGATMMASSNTESVDVSTFEQWYRAPLIGDLHVLGNLSGIGLPVSARSDVRNDYCGVPRPMQGVTVGAIEHSVSPSCDTIPPPHAEEPGGGEGSGSGHGNGNPAPDEAGCCDSSGGAGSGLLALGVLGALVGVRRRRR
jgi:MYXO-CTERM domain-containing protein